MPKSVLLPQCDASLLRRQIHILQKLRDDFLNESDSEIAHDLRIASRRFTEMLRYVGKELLPIWNVRLTKLSREINKRLNRTRELETNIKLLNDFRERGKAHAIAAELLLSILNQRMIRVQRKAQQCLSSKRFEQYREFVSCLRGSHTLSPLHSDVLEMRMKDFLAFRWNIALDDKKLHDLRIRTKRLGYAIEIEEKISRSKHGRLLTRIRNLQELLGKIHDLFVFEEAVNSLRRDWDIPDLKLVPSTLAHLSDSIFEEKSSLYGSVYPLFARIVPALTSAFPPIGAKPVRPSCSINENPPKSHTRKRHVKKLA
ncbi:CHAD domain-containing protein [bacterium]|nr:CHAD domain-containing protein [bacterium]